MISCIITTYRREPDILCRALESIINQTYKDIEIIIVNDAPEYKELSIRLENAVSAYKANIKFINHSKNMGACAARNTGIKYANGEYVAFLDDDDEWMPEKLEEQLKIIEKYKVALVYCDHYFVDSKHNYHYKKVCLKHLEGKNDYERLLCFNYIGSTSFPLINLSILKGVGGFNTKLKSSQDHEVWLKIAKSNDIYYVQKPLVKYYYTDVAITRSIENREQGYNYLLEEFKEDYHKNSKILQCRYILLSVTYFGIKKIKQGLYYWKQAFKINPFSFKNLYVFRRVLEKLIFKS